MNPFQVGQRYPKERRVGIRGPYRGPVRGLEGQGLRKRLRAVRMQWGWTKSLRFGGRGRRIPWFAVPRSSTTMFDTSQRGGDVSNFFLRYPLPALRDRLSTSGYHCNHATRGIPYSSTEAPCYRGVVEEMIEPFRRSKSSLSRLTRRTASRPVRSRKLHRTASKKGPSE